MANVKIFGKVKFIYPAQVVADEVKSQDILIEDSSSKEPQLFRVSIFAKNMSNENMSNIAMDKEITASCSIYSREYFNANKCENVYYYNFVAYKFESGNTTGVEKESPANFRPVVAAASDVKQETKEQSSDGNLPF